MPKLPLISTANEENDDWLQKAFPHLRESEMAFGRMAAQDEGSDNMTTKAMEAELLRLLELDATKHLPGQHDQKRHGKPGPGQMLGQVDPAHPNWTEAMVNSPVSTGERHRAIDHYSDEYKAIMDQWAQALNLNHDEIVERVTKEILAFKAKDPAKFEEYRNWYRTAKKEANAAAQRMGLTEEQMVSMVAVCSIGTPWERNIHDVESFAAWYLKNPEVTLDKAKVEALARSSKHPEFLDVIGGKDGVKVRAFDVHPLMVVACKELMAKDCKAKTGVTRTKTWTDGFGKAARIMRGEDPWIVMEDSAKHTSFAWNIISPEDPDVATIDMWMYRVAANEPRIGKKDFIKKTGDPEIDKPWLWTRPSDGKQFQVDGEDLTKVYSLGTYGLTNVHKVKGVKNPFGAYLWHQQWVEDVADRAGLTPPEAQAIIWSVYRNMPRFKDKMKPDVTA